MKSISYSIIQYRHDPASGEALNVGVLVFDADEGKAALVYERSYRRLADLYESFDGNGYREAFRKFLSGMSHLGHSDGEALFHIDDKRLSSSEDLVRRIWPDLGLSFSLSPLRFAHGEEVRELAKILYGRYIGGLRKADQAVKRRDDHELWHDILRRSQRFEGVASRLGPARIGPQEVEFDYVGRIEKSRKLIAVEPVSLDYLDSSNIVDRAYNLGGKAYDLSEVDEFGRLFVLLGEAKRGGNSESASSRAKRILAKFEKIEVYEENRALEALDSISRSLGVRQA